METLGRFNKALYMVQALNDLQRHWQETDSSSPSINHSQVHQEKRNSLETAPNDLCNTSLRSIMNQRQTHAHLAALAARSYWRSLKNPVKLKISYGKST